MGLSLHSDLGHDIDDCCLCRGDVANDFGGHVSKLDALVISCSLLECACPKQRKAVFRILLLLPHSLCCWSSVGIGTHLFNRGFERHARMDNDPLPPWRLIKKVVSTIIPSSSLSSSLLLLLLCGCVLLLLSVVVAARCWHVEWSRRGSSHNGVKYGGVWWTTCTGDFAISIHFLDCALTLWFGILH